MESNSKKLTSGAHTALLLLLAINLFNYIDRQILAAVLPHIKHDFLAGDPNQNYKAGLLATAFLISYMCIAPIFGLLADRFSRWVLIAISVALWSLASGWSGLAGSFVILLCTRAFVGVGEAGYGPAAPTILSDLYPLEKRGRILAFFYLAMPVGGALGYAFGGKMADFLGWRWAFYLVVPPGLLLAALCFFMRDPRDRTATAPAQARRKPRLADYSRLLRIRSYVVNTAAMTGLTLPSAVFRTGCRTIFIAIERRNSQKHPICSGISTSRLGQSSRSLVSLPRCWAAGRAIGLGADMPVPIFWFLE